MSGILLTLLILLGGILLFVIYDAIRKKLLERDVGIGRAFGEVRDEGDRRILGRRFYVDPMNAEATVSYIVAASEAMLGQARAWLGANSGSLSGQEAFAMERLIERISIFRENLEENPSDGNVQALEDSIWQAKKIIGGRIGRARWILKRLPSEIIQDRSGYPPEGVFLAHADSVPLFVETLRREYPSAWITEYVMMEGNVIRGIRKIKELGDVGKVVGSPEKSKELLYRVEGELRQKKGKYPFEWRRLMMQEGKLQE